MNKDENNMSEEEVLEPRTEEKTLEEGLAEEADGDPVTAIDDELEINLDTDESTVLPSYEDLQQQLVQEQDLVKKNWDKAVRATSDLENYRRRAERDLTKAHKFSIEKLVQALLPIIDSLENALHVDEAEPAHEAIRAGISLTLKMFLDTLEKFNVKQLDPIGQPFDPNIHEAMSLQSDPSAKPGTILLVFQKGYQLYERVIRPARVIVAKNGDEVEKSAKDGQ